MQNLIEETPSVSEGPPWVYGVADQTYRQHKRTTLSMSKRHKIWAQDLGKT